MFWWCLRGFEDAQPDRVIPFGVPQATYTAGGIRSIGGAILFQKPFHSRQGGGNQVMQSNGRGSQTSEGDLCLQSCMMWVGHADKIFAFDTR